MKYLYNFIDGSDPDLLMYFFTDIAEFYNNSKNILRTPKLWFTGPHFENYCS